jgi:hypothetical protein
MGSIAVQWARVLAVLHSFDEANAMARTIACGNYTGAFISIHQAVPCILHLENRCREKYIKMLLLEGFNLFKTGSDQKKFIQDVEVIVNTTVLGMPTCHANWRLATAKDKNSCQAIKDQTMPNTHVRKFLREFHKLTAFCLPNDLLRQQQWNETMERNLMMEGVQSKDHFNEEAVNNLQDLANNWFEHYINLAGRDDGCSNYTHLIALGHIASYLREWGDFYRYSQQGWEAYNSLLKSVYYHSTQRVGLAARETKLLPV